MKIKFVGCISIMNEIERIKKINKIDYTFLDNYYHGRPQQLHRRLQAIIDESQNYDLIVLAYGRCSKGIYGLVSEKAPILMPRVSDCLGLVLGSDERRASLFKPTSGVCCFSSGWLDYGRNPYSEYLTLQNRLGTDKAKALIKKFYQNYHKAVMILPPGMRKAIRYRRQMQEISKLLGWQVEEVKSDLSIVTSLLAGKVNKRTIWVPPGVRITEDVINKSPYNSKMLAAG